ncbi:MAG: AAA family ATPase [Rickettsiales bacterium]|jgi:DNA replication and repair protein RecF|nr:AAA family ATPase [Rickettsiales bacterium]
MPEKYISEVVLNNFRNYSQRAFSFCGGFNAIVGPNGRGKTSLLEAISLVTDARGLRGAQVSDMISQNGVKSDLPDDTLFSIFIKFNDGDKIVLLQKQDKKLIKFNEEQLRSSGILIKILKITYFVPQMEDFFLGARSNRIKFLDRTATLLFLGHGDDLRKYEFFLRERMKILLTQASQSKWLDIVEKKIAELGAAIADVRNRVLEHLNQIFSEHTTEFPTGHLHISGEVENLFDTRRATEIEAAYRKILFSNRTLDAETKKTNFGVHRSNLSVFNSSNGLRAELCSSGEQKMLLLSLIIVKAIFSKQINEGTPILLLDDMCSQIDTGTKNKLFLELKKLNIQIFITDTTEESFRTLENFSDSKIIEL